jgi:hypothetical protein
MFDEAKCIIMTKSKPTRIVARGKRNPANGLYFLRSGTSNLGMNSFMLELPVRAQCLALVSETTNSHPAIDSLLDPRLQVNLQSWNPLAPSSTSIRTQVGNSTVEISPVSYSAATYLWHRRLGHLNYQYLVQLSNQSLGLPKLSAPSGPTYCDHCSVGKNTRTKILKAATIRAEGILDLVHSDLCGPLPIESLGKAKYYILFTDDFLRKTWIYLMSSKDQAFEKFRIFKAMAEKATDRSIRALRIDCGGEYLLGAFE